MDPEKIGSLISKARKDKNMTQKDLANMLHITDKAISKWERGISIPDISLLIPISNILDISVYELLGGEMKEDLSKNEVEEVVKTSVKKGVEDNKLKVRIQKIIITILSVIIVLFSGVFIFTYLGIKTNFVEYLINPTTRPEKIRIEDYGEYNLEITNKQLINDTNKPCDDNNFNCIGQLTSRLPLKNKKISGNESLDTIIYTFDMNEKEYNKSWYNKDYSKKGMVVVSIKSFIIIKNLEYMRFEFKDKTYTISKEDVINFYKDKGIEFRDLTFEDIWKEQVINKLKDKKFMNSFPLKEN